MSTVRSAGNKAGEEENDMFLFRGAFNCFCHTVEFACGEWDERPSGMDDFVSCRGVLPHDRVGEAPAGQLAHICGRWRVPNCVEVQNLSDDHRDPRLLPLHHVVPWESCSTHPSPALPRYSVLRVDGLPASRGPSSPALPLSPTMPRSRVFFRAPCSEEYVFDAAPASPWTRRHRRTSRRYTRAASRRFMNVEAWSSTGRSLLTIRRPRC